MKKNVFVILFFLLVVSASSFLSQGMAEKNGHQESRPPKSLSGVEKKANEIGDVSFDDDESKLHVTAKSQVTSSVFGFRCMVCHWCAGLIVSYANSGRDIREVLSLTATICHLLGIESKVSDRHCTACPL